MKLDTNSEMDRNKAQFYLDKLIAKKAKIELKEVTKQRTDPQRAYLHVCLSMFSVETGYSIEEAKELFAEQLPEIMFYEKKEHRFRKSTNDLTTKEMGILIDYIRSFCMDQLGFYVPDSTEFLINRFQIEKQYGI